MVFGINQGTNSFTLGPVLDNKGDVIGEGEKEGLSLPIAVIFLSGLTAGVGILALPHAVNLINWAGFLLIVVCCIIAAIGGMVLAKCWIIVQERDPSLKEHVRNPYPTIGYHAFGAPGRFSVSFVIWLFNFGSTVVFIILLSDLTHSLVEEYMPPEGIHSTCIWMLVFGAILCPITWFGSPKEFWGMALFSLGSTVIADILVIVQLCNQRVEGDLPRAEFELNGLFFAFGTILVSFGGATCFPSIQNDMKRREKFPIAVLIGFCILLVLYLGISITSYLTIGNNTGSDILLTLNDGAIKKIVEVLLITHLLSTFSLVLSPIAQELEGKLSVPTSFCWQRVVVRTGLVSSAVFVAETVPSFGNVLGLLGGLVTPPTSLIFPIIFYIKLCHIDGGIRIPVYQWILFIVTLVIGVLGGAAATYASVKAIIADEMHRPCYI